MLRATSTRSTATRRRRHTRRTGPRLRSSTGRDPLPGSSRRTTCRSAALTFRSRRSPRRRTSPASRLLLPSSTASSGLRTRASLWTTLCLSSTTLLRRSSLPSLCLRSGLTATSTTRTAASSRSAASTLRTTAARSRLSR
eukprot:Amastigsp_a509022_512.p3 type:complete len:140 gc:universal Amastigsp_a509022_512:883-464(-)